ncbi:response regulator transcription factor [Neorhizobium sp. JUb45]|uniref:response regulator transcription factor n=1 Tax=Neorhizobium sp. JUb45 TaxID=2485113 RepID=UPI00104C1EC2|nr:response regulator transcription factor [Neorhizobium sp. JUb45]TCQ95408.1 winged helix family two component transcriptional regulator [Neorhizobium sp. JUb45]
MRLLLIEDELEMARALSAVLAQHNYVVDHMPTIELALEAIKEKVHDVVVLDRQLPDGDGLTFLRAIRDAGDRTPVIVLTAHNMPADRISGLDDGADDYLGKPFLADELLARLRAVARRSGAYTSQVISEGNVSVDLDHHEVSIGGEVISLPRREVLVLELLMKRFGRTVLRRSLEEAVYGYDDEIQSNALDSHVSRLRKKLVDADANLAIHGIRGLGYLLRAS